MTYSNTYSSPSSPTNFNPFSGMGMRKGGRPSLFPGSGDGSTLNLDFTTGVLDSRLTFSRASTATFVNSSGYVEWAGTNTAYSSESLSTGLGYSDNAIISPRSTTTSPTGNTAVVFYPTLVSDYHRVQFGGPIAMVGATTISVYVKQIGSNYRVGINSTGYIGAGAIFSLVGVGSVVAVGGTAANRAATVTKVTDDGWYRIALTGTYTALTSTYLFMDSSTSTDYTGGPFTGVASQGVSFWGFQINPGSTAQTYYPTTATLYYAPRFDYSPTNIGEPRGLLIEGQGVNLARYSETLETTGGYWGYNAATRTVESSDVNPTNGTGSISFGPTSNGGSRYCGLFLTGQTTTTAYTFSAWIKAKGTSSAVVSIQNSAGAVNSTVTILSQPSGANASIAGNGGGFPRLSSLSSSGWTKIQVVTSSTLGGTGALNVFVYPNDTSTQTTADTMFMWGAQLEAGSGASSYIPTGASQVTRNADQCSMTGSNFTNVFGDGSLGTITCSHEFSRADRGLAHQPTPFAIGSYTATNARGYSYGSYTLGVTSNYGWVYTSAAFSFATTSAAFAAKNKCAIAYNGLALTAALNGTTNSATGSGTITVSSAIGLQIGYNTSPRDFINACVSNIKFYPTALTAAQLQILTAP